MNEQIANAIQVLVAKIATKEKEVIRLKQIVNEFCAEAGEKERFPGITEAGVGSSMSLRTDHFYGQTITGAARAFLEMRGSAQMGAANINDIFAAMKEGGFKFGTNNEENAKTALRTALRKTSSIFHRLPNGDYGLLTWYPGAKAPKEENGDDDPQDSKKVKKQTKTTGKASDEAPQNGAVNGKANLSNSEIREVILKMSGTFSSAEISKALSEAFPKKTLKHNALPLEIYNLKKRGILRMVTERDGKKGATYSKA